MDLLLLAARALGPVIRRFISLGLNRVWLKAGDTAYRCASLLLFVQLGVRVENPETLGVL